MTEKEKMTQGKLYIPQDTALIRDYKRAKELTHYINTSTGEQEEERRRWYQELFGRLGAHAWIAPPLYCDYGFNIFAGDYLMVNYYCIFLDVCPIYMGNHIYIGPHVGLYTALHPIDASVRNQGLEYGKPISIGDSVWIGGHAVVNPGVTIGSRVVIGSGSVVTHDIPDDVIAVGNPCRVLRSITDEDRRYWETAAYEYWDSRKP